jgi:hypothetical protein
MLFKRYQKTFHANRVNREPILRISVIKVDLESYKIVVMKFRNKTVSQLQSKIAKAGKEIKNIVEEIAIY